VTSSAELWDVDPALGLFPRFDYSSLDPVTWIEIDAGSGYRVKTNAEPLSRGGIPVPMSFLEEIAVCVVLGAVPLTAPIEDARLAQASVRTVVPNVPSPDGAHMVGTPEGNAEAAKFAAWYGPLGTVLRAGGSKVMLAERDRRQVGNAPGAADLAQRGERGVAYYSWLRSDGSMVEHGRGDRHINAWKEYGSFGYIVQRAATRDGESVDMLYELARGCPLGGPLAPWLVAALGGDRPIAGAGDDAKRAAATAAGIATTATTAAAATGASAAMAAGIGAAIGMAVPIPVLNVAIAAVAAAVAAISAALADGLKCKFHPDALLAASWLLLFRFCPGLIYANIDRVTIKSGTPARRAARLVRYLRVVAGLVPLGHLGNNGVLYNPNSDGWKKLPTDKPKKNPYIESGDDPEDPLTNEAACAKIDALVTKYGVTSKEIPSLIATQDQAASALAVLRDPKFKNSGVLAWSMLKDPNALAGLRAAVARIRQLAGESGTDDALSNLLGGDVTPSVSTTCADTKLAGVPQGQTETSRGAIIALGVTVAAAILGSLGLASARMTPEWRARSLAEAMEAYARDQSTVSLKRVNDAALAFFNVAGSLDTVEGHAAATRALRQASGLKYVKNERDAIAAREWAASWRAWREA
jgi:hypothetical protein